MNTYYKSGVSPQHKMVSVNQKFGNTGVKNQQGTTNTGDLVTEFNFKTTGRKQ
jgi:hypothetical protein